MVQDPGKLAAERNAAGLQSVYNSTVSDVDPHHVAQVAGYVSTAAFIAASGGTYVGALGSARGLTTFAGAAASRAAPTRTPPAGASDAGRSPGRKSRPRSAASVTARVTTLPAGVNALGDAQARRARVTNGYDDRGQVFGMSQIEVDPSNGNLGGNLTTTMFYNGRGDVTKAVAPGGRSRLQSMTEQDEPQTCPSAARLPTSSEFTRTTMPRATSSP